MEFFVIVTAISDKKLTNISKEIPLLIKPILEKKADIVIGNRQVETLDHMPMQKRIGNRLVSKALSNLDENQAVQIEMLTTNGQVIRLIL